MAFTWNPVMVEGAPNGNGRKRLFEPVFNLSGLITIVTIIVGGLAAFYSVKQDLATAVTRSDAVQEVLSVRAKQVDKQLDTLQDGINSINALILLRAPTRYSRDDAIRDFNQVNTRLDGHEQRIQRLETRPAR